MKYIKKFENYLTKKDQPKSNYDEYLYDFGFGDRYHICSNCDSNKLIPTLTGGFSPPEWHCKDCGHTNHAPKYMSLEEYPKYLEDKEIKKSSQKYNL